MKKTLLSLFYFAISCFTYSQVVINEYSAANYNGFDFNPPNQVYEDWIELYNAGTTPVSIGGYYLSDKLNNLQKWQIPNGISIPAGGHYVFIASGSGNVQFGYQNTNFSLNQTKSNEYIILSNASAVIVDSIHLNYPNQVNQSRGRTTDGANTWAVFQTPTVGAANTNAKLRYAIKPTFSLTPGFYSGTQNLSLSTTESGATIRYTTNGSEPTSSSIAYTNPLSITQTTVVRAKVFSSNSQILPSHTETNTYFINENHSVKVISVCGNQLFDLFDGTQSEPWGSLELFENDGTFLTEATGEFNKHGNDSWFYDQRGVDFVARDQFGINYALEDEIFDTKTRDEFQRVILKCGASDNFPFEQGGAHIRDAYVQQMSQLGDLRLDERSVEFAVLYLNGQYWGVYDIREKTDDKDFTSYYYDQDVPNIQYLKTWGNTWEEYGAPNAQNDWDNLLNFINTNNMTVPANYQYVDSLYNTGSLIDYFILNGFVVCADWLNWNTGWWRGLNPSGDKKKWRYTLWDMDATFDHYINYTGVPDQSANADPCDPETFGDPGGQGHVPIWNKLLTNDEFFADYINRYAELSSTVFSCDSMHNLLNHMVAEIQPEMQRHATRWGGNYSQWLNNVQDIHDFIDTRCVTIATGIVDCYQPEISGPYTVTVQVSPALSGDVQLHTLTPNSYPYTGTYFGGVNIDLDADAFAGWTFDHWTINNNTLSPNLTTEQVVLMLNSNDTVTAYFVPDVAIDYDTLVFTCNPIGSGNVVINGTTVSTFPHTAYVQAGNLVTLTANANSGFTFNHWAMQNHTPAPNATNTSVSITSSNNDSITMFFDVVPPTIYDTITYLINPTLSGTITINGTNDTSFPYTAYYSQGTSVNLQANANAGYAFSFWDAQNNNLSSVSNANTQFSATANDTITANFTELYEDTLIVMMIPNGAGTLNVGGDIITTTPYLGVYPLNNSLPITAVPNSNASFNHWELASLSLPDYNLSSSFVFLHKDTLTAYFNAPTALNNLGNDLDYLIVFPSINQGEFTLEFLAKETTNISLKLVNMNGQLVKDWHFTATNSGTPIIQKLQFDGAAGVYLLQVNSLKTNASLKLIKTN